ncbi:protein lin-9 homolog [Drosophila eugracilis]|uniref:protein lin-9 homolog n=1 Tax=Drosophila eugracilis TaxID=29029 RepID=UPI0007E7541B|nr:protein lin-9 homolog [Drosophila eugracilis]
MPIDRLTRKSLTNQTEISEENKFLANIGLLANTTMSEIRQRQVKNPKKLVTGFEDDELFVKRPDFTKINQVKEEPVSQRKTGPDVSAPECSSGEEYEEENQRDDLLKNKFLPAKRLYNFLKQLSSHRWIWCEFVDSVMDKSTLGCTYDMKHYLTECFPDLATCCMPRRGWQLIRRCMGKARRYSPAFIEQERGLIQRYRRMVRKLQQNRYDSKEDDPFANHLPKRIPLPLTVDAKVTSFLVGPDHKGIIDGCVLDYNPEDFTYLVRFVKNGKIVVLSLLDLEIHSQQESKTLSTSMLMEANQKPKSTETKAAKTERVGDMQYTKELLESILQVKKHLDIKRKTVMEIAQMTADFEEGKESTVSSSRRDARMTSEREKLQRRYAAHMITLHRVNTDVIEPMHILYEYLAEYQKQEDELEAKGGPPTSGVFFQCRQQAELDVKSAGIEKSLKVQSDDTREFISNLQTLLYLNGRLGCVSNNDLDLIITDLIAKMVANIHPSLASQLKAALESLEPLRKQVAAMFQANQFRAIKVTQQLETADGVPNFVVEAQPDTPF